MSGPDLVVVVPSRGRPEAARALVEVFAQTCTAATQLVFAVDADDPTRDEYAAAGSSVGPSTSMVEALNIAATYYADHYGLPADLNDGAPFAVAFMGDDHRPRTHGWDEQYLAALRELGTGIVYGDDLLQGANLPTQCAMTADIVRELGYMAPPALTHLYVDNFWRALGETAGCLRFLPEVVVEHAHPLAGKARWDPGYARVNDQGMYAKDQAAFEAYVESGQFAVDAAKVRALRVPRG